MKKISLYIMLIFTTTSSVAQQLPYYSQFRGNIFMINPGTTGTTNFLDARLNQRIQWIGYDGAPKTSSLSLNSRLLKGKMGAGMYLLQDYVGPTKKTDIGLSYAFHLRYPDVELSVGFSGDFTRYSLVGSKVTIHNTQDPSVDQTSTTVSKWVPDANFGIYLYNDRFHLGVSALHLLESRAILYKSDSVKKGAIPYVTNVNATLGYNYAQNPRYIWESTVYGNYTLGQSIMLDYTLRVHYNEKLMGGFSIRMRDAVAIHMGMTFLNYFQVTYSHDFLMSKVRNYSSGSHEIMLIFKYKVPHKNGRVDPRFLHQKYSYLL